LTKLTKRNRDRAKWALEEYREDKKQINDYIKKYIPNGTSPYSLTGGIIPGEAGRPTEQAAIKMAMDYRLLMIQIKVAAIDRALARCDEIDNKIIDMLYWKKTHTIAGVALAIPISVDAVKYRITKILKRIAAEMGLM
jgi:RinA family phage transcriptional activator